MLSSARFFARVTIFATFLAATAGPAPAVPLFAHRYGVSCMKCHSVIPELNAFGSQFMAHGDRILGVTPGPAFPFSAKVNLVASNVNQGSGPDGRGLPKAIVDEIELFAAGTIGERADYFAEQYVVDGGEPGDLREAWIDFRIDPWQARVPASIQVGQFGLPLPVDPETFRRSYQHYTIYDQTVGNNPFSFFEPKDGTVLNVGSAIRGTSLNVFAGPGRDRFSGLPTSGIDTMENASHVLGHFTLGLYRYDGTRPSGNAFDRFVRRGYALSYAAGRWSSQTVMQTGFDSDPYAMPGIGASSSGGFSLLRYQIGPRLFAYARYEGTNQPDGFTRDTVLLFGCRPSRNAALTLEDVVSHAPGTTNTITMQYTAGY